MRASTTAVLSLSLAAGLSACGGGTSKPGSSSTSSHTVALANVKPMSAAEGKAFAKAVNLRPADLSGFKASSEGEHEGAAEKRENREFQKCVGAPASHRPLLEAGSLNFEHQTSFSEESVRSDVEVAPSAAVAAQELAAASSTRARSCLSIFLSRLFRSKSESEVTLGSVSIAAITPSAPGTSGSFGWQVSANITSHGLDVPLRFDFLGFGYRTAMVVLFDLGLPKPFVEAKEHELFSRLISRATGFSG
jgi:hypothetical protein